MAQGTSQASPGWWTAGPPEAQAGTAEEPWEMTDEAGTEVMVGAVETRGPTEKPAEAVLGSAEGRERVAGTEWSLQAKGEERQ